MLIYRTRAADTLGSLACYWYPDLLWWQGAELIQRANDLKGEWDLPNRTLVIPEPERRYNRCRFS